MLLGALAAEALSMARWTGAKNAASVVSSAVMGAAHLKSSRVAGSILLEGLAGSAAFHSRCELTCGLLRPGTRRDHFVYANT